jgi:nucleotide-binding universal stress UspA family protein
MVAFNQILVPTDFSEHSFRALDYAVEIAEKFSSEMKVVYVIEPVLQAADVAWSSVDFDKLNEAHKHSAEEQLRSLIEERIPKSVSVEYKILFGKPFVEIVKQAKTDNSDLIVMATHGRGAITHMLLGSTTEKVVRKAPCPVLAVKHPKHLFAMP